MYFYKSAIICSRLNKKHNNHCLLAEILWKEHKNLKTFGVFKFWWLSHNIRTLQANRHRNTYLGIQINAKEVDSSKKYVKKTQSNAHSSLRRIICLVCIKNGLQCPVYLINLTFRMNHTRIFRIVFRQLWHAGKYSPS